MYSDCIIPLLAENFDEVHVMLLAQSADELKITLQILQGFRSEINKSVISCNSTV